MKEVNGVEAMKSGTRNLGATPRSRYRVAMAHEVCFTKKLEIKDSSSYVNECCWGGHVVRDRILPSIRAEFSEVQTNQEDWGWFIWIRGGRTSMAVAG
jgi:hypothetical protein